MPRLAASEYSNERIKTTITQSFNYDDAFIVEVSEEALKRGLYSEIELKRILKDNKDIQQKKNDENYKEMQQIRLNRIENNSKIWDATTIVAIVSLVISIGLYFAYGIIAWYIVMPTFGVAAYGKSRKNMFRR